MAQWYERLYTGVTIAKKVRKVKRMVNKGKFLPDLYLVTAAANGVDQLDILDARNLLIPSVRKNLPCVVGIALGKQEALELVRSIAEETYAATGDGDIRAYLWPQEQERS